MGFSQVTTSDEIKKYFNRGKDIAGKHLEVLSSTLLKEDLPAPMTWDHDVTIVHYAKKIPLQLDAVAGFFTYFNASRIAASI